MSRRLAATLRRLRERFERRRERKTLERALERAEKRQRRRRIKAGEPEGTYEAILAIRYEVRQLGAEVKRLMPARPGGDGGLLDGARDVVSAVDDAAGDLNLDGESKQFDNDDRDEPAFDPLGVAEQRGGFDPWTAGEQTERD